MTEEEEELLLLQPGCGLCDSGSAWMCVAGSGGCDCRTYNDGGMTEKGRERRAAVIATVIILGFIGFLSGIFWMAAYHQQLLREIGAVAIGLFIIWFVIWFICFLWKHFYEEFL